jgi:MFS transporter, PAT family, beta-lactamase induction signal transducer AmpG
MAVLFALGFSSGLPLYLTLSTLTAWLATAHVDRTKIAAFTLVGIPYTFKFAWAPLLDRYAWPFLGRRRGWLLFFQLCLVVAIVAMAGADPAHAPFQLAVLALTVAFFSASQDIVFDAYCTDLLTPEQRAAGSGISVTGYRVAMLVSGTLALILADHMPWRLVYLSMAALMSVGVIATLLSEEPLATGASRPPTLLQAVKLPFQRFYQRFGARDLAVIVFFTMLYRFGDWLLESLKTPFYIEQGFSLTQIATINKLFAFLAVAAGAFCVGAIAPRLGVRRALVVFGILQAATNLTYLLLAHAGKSYVALGLAIFSDNFAGTMGIATLVAFMMSLCDREVSATQYALLTGLSSVGGRLFGWIAGPMSKQLGWEGFFVATTFIALPGLLLVSLLPIPNVSRQDAEPSKL